MAYTPKDWSLSDDITESDLDHIEQGIATLAADSGWLTTGITAATGWSIDSQKYAKRGSTVWVYVAVTRTGSAINPVTNGDVSTDSLICTLPAGYRPATAWGLGSGGGDRIAVFKANTDVTVLLSAMNNDSAINTTTGKLVVCGVLPA